MGKLGAEPCVTRRPSKKFHSFLSDKKNANPIILNIRHNFLNQLKEMRKISRDPINSGGVAESISGITYLLHIKNIFFFSGGVSRAKNDLLQEQKNQL